MAISGTAFHILVIQYRREAARKFLSSCKLTGRMPFRNRSHHRVHVARRDTVYAAP